MAFIVRRAEFLELYELCLYNVYLPEGRKQVHTIASETYDVDKLVEVCDEINAFLSREGTWDEDEQRLAEQKIWKASGRVTTEEHVKALLYPQGESGGLLRVCLQQYSKGLIL